MSLHHDIAKHTKKAIQHSVGDGTISHRLKEIALEIFVIVFGVSLSIWLHGVVEHHGAQSQVEKFLVGLRSDLKSDIAQANDAIHSYNSFDNNFQYLLALKPGDQFDPVKFEKAYGDLRINYSYVALRSRFEGFSSSGRLSNIENDELLSEIFDYYQGSLGKIINSENGWRQSQAKLLNYLESDLDVRDDVNNKFKLITSAKGHRLLEQAVSSRELYARFSELEKAGNVIVLRINKEYGTAK